MGVFYYVNGRDIISGAKIWIIRHHRGITDNAGDSNCRQRPAAKGVER
jgi:hypothetical protein